MNVASNINSDGKIFHSGRRLMKMFVNGYYSTSSEHHIKTYTYWLPELMTCTTTKHDRKTQIGKFGMV